VTDIGVIFQAIHQAVDYALANSTKGHLGYAALYIRALPRVMAEQGLHEGLHSQLPYILNNLQAWKGPEARAAKKILNDFLKERK